MSHLSKRFEQIVVRTQKKFLDKGTILPEKTDKGIRVGIAEIRPNGVYKDIYRNEDLVFPGVCLNKVAIKLANLVAWNQGHRAIEIYQADQDYNKFYVETTVLMSSYNMAKESKKFFKADVIWARYTQVKQRANQAKKKAERLASL